MLRRTARQGKMEDESQKMILDTTDRLAKAYGELRDLVVSRRPISCHHDRC